MAVAIKSEREIELMRQAGRFLALTHLELEKVIKPGMSTKDVDRIAEETIRSYGCIPTSLNYNGFPGSACVSLNDEIIHGIPSDKRIIRDGDIVSLDITLSYKGYQSDAARTLAVGNVSKEALQLIEVTKQSFYEGLKYAKAGNHINDIGKAVQAYVEQFGYGVVRDFVGHGIGKEMHESPEVPNFDTGRRGMKLKPGMTITIEPMINAGTILITSGEPEILSILH